MSTIADKLTIEIYAREAGAYAQRDKPQRIGDFLTPFMAGLPPGAVVLDLGCGSGWAAVEMQERGFDVHALDASPELAAIAQAKLARPVRVMSFEGLEDVAAFDGIWSSAALLHVAKADMPGLLARLARALKPGGLLLATFKAGEGEGRDKLGRFYAYYALDELRALVERVPGLDWLPPLTGESVDFTGVPTVILGLSARRRGD